MTRCIGRNEWDRAQAALHTAWLAKFCIILIMGGLVRIMFLLLPTIKQFGEDGARLTLLLLLVYSRGTIMFRLNTTAGRADKGRELSGACIRNPP